MMNNIKLLVLHVVAVAVAVGVAIAVSAVDGSQNKITTKSNIIESNKSSFFYETLRVLKLSSKSERILPFLRKAGKQVIDFVVVVLVSHRITEASPYAMYIYINKIKQKCAEYIHQGTTLEILLDPKRDVMKPKDV
uniref:Uncharacterized protein n=1 Tax=Glossina pallidipes TaxID=7398 RepID=A0A1A9Z8S5_GLOPL